MLVIVIALNLVVVIDSGMFAEICMQRKIQMCIYFIDIFDMWHVYVAERDTAHVKIMHTVRALFSFIVIKEWFILTHNMHSHFIAPYYYTPASEKQPWIMWELFPSCLNNKKTRSQLFQYSIPEYYRLPIYRGTIEHYIAHSTALSKVKLRSHFKLTKDTHTSP